MQVYLKMWLAVLSVYLNIVISFMSFVPNYVRH